MKKVLVIAALLSSMVASATEVSVNYVRDFNLDRNGVSVEVSPFNGNNLSPVVSLTHVNSVYTRYGVGVNYGVTDIGPVKVSVNGGGVFQDSSSSSNGFGLTVGASASYPINKMINVNLGVNQFFGQKRIDGFDGAQATLGVSSKF